ncbi:MAG: hypothetical protein ACRETY_12240 [Steroidobacteraceae bacterium]
MVAVALSVIAAGLILRGRQNDTEITAAAAISADSRPFFQSAAPPRAFPESELLAALTAACVVPEPNSADQELTQDGAEAQIDAFNKLKASLSARLSASSSEEHLLLTAMLEDDPVSRAALLDRAISRSPSDPFLIWHAVRICSESGESAPCPLRDWEQLLIAVDGQNSESWIRVAANRFAERDYDAALDAMRQASAAAESRDYWTESVEVIERGLAAGSDYAFPERAGMAFGLASAGLPRYGDYVKMCREQSARSVDWAHACLAYGERLANRGKTDINESIARTMQRLALEALGEADKAAAVERRYRARRQMNLALFKNDYATVERLTISSPTLFSAYLAKVRSEGEAAARQYMSVEVRRLLELQPELACE